MTITLKYFGQLAEVFETSEETRDLENINVTDLIKEISSGYDLDHIPYQIAVNQRIIDCNEQVNLNDGDTLALLPPFAGG
ncbi:MoaD/ThiS family protein [Leeuwenhoekiella aequorea]|uniref:Molybdopterin synthase sulfur carrier subunit n=1 Tax=Leeuwenhoekiella aequorea TaxID=283736 RepID=A0A4Q0P9I4_9FLAO|nr:MoaD/ThiS family protein [Leeuwenhoekiella aequorea]RXG23357.1 molybdopterin synthase sulfur carrier subunit [Leeuwenhoekiella aequorea]